MISIIHRKGNLITVATIGQLDCSRVRTWCEDHLDGAYEIMNNKIDSRVFGEIILATPEAAIAFILAWDDQSIRYYQVDHKL